jgi:hypothetical protein
VVGTITRCRDWLPPTWANTVLASKQSNRHWNRRQASLTSPRPPRPRPSWPVFQRRVPVPPRPFPFPSANLTFVHSLPLAPASTGEEEGDSQREREKHTAYTHPHTDIDNYSAVHTHPHTDIHTAITTHINLTIAIRLFTAACIASPGSVAVSRPSRRLVFSRRIPHSRVDTHSPALLAPVQHENNRRRLFTLRGNPLAMHRSGTQPQHLSLGRS